MSCFGGSFPQRRRACSKSLIQVCSALPDDDSDAETESSGAPGEDLASLAPSDLSHDSSGTPPGLLSGSDQLELASSHDSEDHKPLPPTPSPSSPTAAAAAAAGDTVPGAHHPSPPHDPLPPFRLEAQFRVLLAAAQRRLEQDRREAEGSEAERREGGRREAERREGLRRDSQRQAQERRELMAGRGHLEGRDRGWEEGVGAGGREEGEWARALPAAPAAHQGQPHRAPQWRGIPAEALVPRPVPRHVPVATAGHPGYARNGGAAYGGGRRRHPAARSLRRAFETLPLEGNGLESPPHSPFSPSPSSSPVAAAS